MGRKEFDPAKIVQTKFTPSETIMELAASARTYSGQEKQGVHEIAQRNPSVIDLEIAFTKTDEEGKKSAPRIALAALHNSAANISFPSYQTQIPSASRLPNHS